MSAKLKVATRYLFREQLKYLGLVYFYVIASLAVIPFLFALFTGTLNHLSFGHLFVFNFSFIFGLFAFIWMTFSYDNFKLFIQNGISRKTFWLARLLSLLMVSLIGELLATIYYFAVSNPIQHWHFAQGFNHQFYAQLYGTHFGSGTMPNLIAGFILTWLLFVALGLSGMALGSIFSLLTKTVRRVVLIAIPILGGFFLVLLMNVSSPGSATDAHTKAIFEFLYWLMGGSNHDSAGSLNPIMPALTLIVIGILMAAIAYYFNRKLKLKNA